MADLIAIQGTTVKIPDQTFWQLEVCNACRYCEGYCAVFPALERKRRFSPEDVVYLANLCHDCRACFYACMYAPPHEFGVNIPKALAEVREQTYSQYALPKVVSNLARRNAWLLVIGGIVSLIFFGIVAALSPTGLFTARQGPGAFYSVIPYLVMMLPALLISLYAIWVMLAGAFAFARDIGARRNVTLRQTLSAASEALSLRYLRGGTAGGCFYPTERTSNARLGFHMLVFYGFISAFVATIIAAVMQDIFGLEPPYPILSPPVILGSLGGIGLIVGATGLLVLKWRSDRHPADGRSLNLDWLFLLSLNVVAITGMLLLILRETPAMGVLLVVHLATVLALYVSAPYGKFAHFLYRYAALVQNRIESR
ncbi:MAG: tricarballylate utilization 4Fe-4S protein TcuB [Chloroflexi bacterium]|nr:tricarballylate utilization 4Fe-4S protein TcuB [Chloroflexota bacterium]MBV9598990.1 tricarballylate utilization 4Fe-4S protein TcuB [Chloroflexota bacterium]